MYRTVPVIGLTAAALCAVLLLAACLRAERRRPFGWPGWAGLAAFAGCAAILASPAAAPAPTVPLAWSGLVLAADSAVHALRGRSLLRTRPEVFVWLATLSVFLWLPFEWYNLQLGGWYRAGLPSGPARYLVLGWSFACLWPALFETADLLLALAGRRPPTGSSRRAPRRAWTVPVVATGVACLALPLLVPRLDLGERLLPAAAAGFLLVLDPVNAAGGRPSLWGDWLAGGRARAVALMASGLFCGLVADCLNHAASARLYCIASLPFGAKVVEWPALAYLAFPVFALQAFAMHASAAAALGLPPAPLPSWSRVSHEDAVGARAQR